MNFLYLLAGVQSFSLIRERKEREKWYNIAFQRSRYIGKPLIVFGSPKGRHGCGDVLFDLRPTGECPVEVQGDISDLSMFRDKEFGVAFVSHVLEHLSSQKMEKALYELQRIANSCVILYPSTMNMLARFQKDHNQRSLTKLWKMNSGGVLQL